MKISKRKSRGEPKNSLPVPSFVEERALEVQGFRYIAGIDEVGRGALAGPVMAAAVILPLKIDAPWLSLVRDSKQLSPGRRESLFDRICEVAVAVGTGGMGCEVIDNKGIIMATQLAMKAAVDNLLPPAEALLIDYMYLPQTELPQKGITHGDSYCFSIACASIVAKVTRDRLMIELDNRYPGYMLAQHKGYGTPDHHSCLYHLGPSPIHRFSFKPVRDIISVNR